MRYLIQFGISYLSAFGFCLIFSCPKKSLPFSALAGAVGWTSYIILSDLKVNIFAATAIGAYFTAILGEVMARGFHMPASVYTIPGIINLCPGAGIYYTLSYFVNGQSNLATSKLVETAALAGAISFGILLASVSSKSLNGFKFRKAERVKYTK